MISETQALARRLSHLCAKKRASYRVSPTAEMQMRLKLAPLRHIIREEQLLPLNLVPGNRSLPLR